MLENIYQIPHEESLSVDWQGYDLQYDLQLYELGQGHSEFFVINPNNNIPEKWKTDLKYYVEELPDTRKCTVVVYEGDWIVKTFKDGWYPYHGYETVEIVKTKLAWTRNSDIDKLITYEDDPFGTFDPSKWDRDYKLVWYMDPRFNPLEDKVWAFSCQPIGKEILGTKDMGYVVPDVLVQFNDHLPDLGVDANDCCPPFYDLAHECAYELDPIHQVNNERLWVVKFTPMWRNPKEWKWLGTVSPEFTIIYNPDLPKMDYDLDYTMPWHDFDYEHVWMLDRKHLKEGEDDIWAFTIQVTEELEGSKIVDYVSPSVDVIYNPSLPELDYDIEYTIPWYDLAYEHVWMLDNKHLQNNEEPMWAVKSKTTLTKPKGSKVIGHVSPTVNIEYNPALPKLDYNEEYVVPWHDLAYEHVWYLATNKTADKVWAVRASMCNKPVGEKEIGTVTLLFEDHLDVIFISYKEPNADENWNRVLEKAPWAKRVHGVEGIFNAHKAAAKLATTDMFFVVDGDAYLTYDWEFDFQPGIFDRDCTYVWKSKNPINNLTYGYGGVKLFDRSGLTKLKKWGSDLTLSASKKLKVMDRISNITRFNTSEYDTWKAAFRECAKLAKKTDAESNERLQSWLNPTGTANFADWAKKGAEQGVEFSNNNENIEVVNDYKWLQQQFINNYNSIEKQA